ncbi:MAG: 30S ribosome-binding factor RbfA [Proteobacteria bacterium]|nr:30S ribosome-binding factor RbfA [Pseudomonadota bacterium]MBU1569976.1 30S ribosome-binding factor RbfA [Pseudomonadota bacterium]
MTLFSRADRVAGQIQKILSEILIKDIKDPRLDMATITGVKMSRDLKLARIYFTISGSNKSAEDAAIGFKSAAGYLKRTLASQLGLRYMPDLSFFYDESFDYGARIETLLKTLKNDDEPDNSTPEKE